MFFMVHFLTPEIQGYAYTFTSVLAMSIFLEMGFSQNILQFASHEFSRLELTPERGLKGNGEALSRLTSLGRLSFRYYGAAALLFFVFLIVGGRWFFKTAAGTGVAWEGAWILACISTALSLATNPCWAILEGCNQIAEVERFRFHASWLSFALTAGCLAGGLELYSFVVPSLVAFLFSAVYLILRWRKFFAIFLKEPLTATISWKREIWPFQWRIAISWMSGYFIFFLATPVVFGIAGPAQAGRFGFTMQLVKTISAMAGSWTITKLPMFGMLVAQKNWKLLDKTWKRATIATLSVAILGSVGMIIGVEVISIWYPKLASRYAGPSIATILCISMIFQCITSAGAYYLRAFKSEPYMNLSILNAALSAIFIPLLTKFFGINGAAIGYTAAIAIVAVPAYLMFKKKRTEYIS